MAKVAEIKTKQTEASVTDFLDVIADEKKRKDAYEILRMMEQATKQKPKMWGASLIGFGNLRYKSPATGREVDWFTIGFSPRKANFSLYVGVSMDKVAALLPGLGKHKTGMGCLYINKLADVDVKVLDKIIHAAIK